MRRPSMPRVSALLLLPAALACLVACSRAPEAPHAQDMVLPALQAATPLPTILVHKSTACACCAAWIGHLRQAGFAVREHNTEDLAQIKDRLGVPAGERSCHTAEVDGYFVEGHVPAVDIKRMLAERPTARGLALPGMPIGSPGMEGHGEAEPFTVGLVAGDGSVTVYGAHAP